MVNYNDVSKILKERITNELERLNIPVNPMPGIAMSPAMLNQNIQREMIITQQTNQYRLELLQSIAKKTGRNVVSYFSGWLNFANIQTVDFSVNENDVIGLHSAIAKIKDKGKKLDLILQTPGGSVTAAEKIINYLKQEFNDDFRVIVPHMAMSAGTMIACASKEILMFNQSSLGPFDPHWYGYPCFSILNEFELAKKEVNANQVNSLVWKEILQKYQKTELIQCQYSIELAKEIALKNLKNMIRDDKKIKEIVNILCSNSESKVHDRHYGYNKCKELGLKVTNLDIDDQEKIADDVMSLYYSYMYTLSLTPLSKIIESNFENSYIIGLSRR